MAWSLSDSLSIFVMCRVFKQGNIEKLTGYCGLGHVRYPTAGSPDRNEAQPFYTNFPYIAIGSFHIDMELLSHIMEI